MAKSTADVATVLAALERAGTAKQRDSMARYGIVAPNAYGVSVATIQKLAKGYGKNHALAAALWASGVYEARMMASFVDEPERVTVAQMNRWCAEFDNWAVCDTITFHLFDRTPHALGRIEAWHTRREEYVKRAAFALLAAVALHDKALTSAQLVRTLAWCEAASTDERHLVKKGVSWALRVIGVRNRELHAATLALGTRLAASTDPTARWIGKDVVRDLQRPVVARKLAKLATAR
jgi:3-methyladenine DNA glycosylase AlkD